LNSGLYNSDYLFLYDLYIIYSAATINSKAISCCKIMFTNQYDYKTDTHKLIVCLKKERIEVDR